MNIDWAQLNKGIVEELEKSAAVMPTSLAAKVAPLIAKVITPKNVAIGGGLATAGFGLQNGVNAAREGISSAIDTAGQYLPQALGMLSGTGRSSIPGMPRGPLSINVSKSTPTMFSGALRGVNTMGEGLKLGAEKQADIFDAVGGVALRRTINKALDTASAPAKLEAPHEKELEIVSEYPEMAQLLKDKQNKAYLERLLKEQ